MSPLIRMLITQAAIGFAIAAVLVATLLAFDIGHVRDVVSNSDKRVLAVLQMWFLSGVVFGALQCAIAMMGRGDDDDDDQDGGHPAYKPIPIRVTRNQRR